MAIAALTLAANVGFAQDEEGFSGRVALGYLATSGNTENDSLNTNLGLWWNYEPWSHSLLGRAVRSSTSSVTTAEAYSLAWKSNYAINETDYIFGLVAWDKDEFSAYEQQIREAIGYGRRFIDNERHVLSGQAGIGARQADLRNGVSQDETILHLGGDYRWLISETSEFSQTLWIDSGSDNTYLEATSALSANVRDNLALVISYTIKNNSDVLPGTEKTDTFTAISLEYTF
jgi:putative salt-induced outer membrane protein